MRDLENHPDCRVIYKDRLHPNFFLNAFCLTHIIRRIKQLVRIPFRKKAYEMTLGPFCDANTQLIAMTTGWYCRDYIDFIRHNYPHVKLVLLIRDTVEDNTKRNKEFRIDKVKEQFDLVISYDNMHDVPVYGLTYAPVYMSTSREIDLSAITCQYDIAFIGTSKDRLSTIHRIYQLCTGYGLKPYFYIFRVKDSDRLPGIVYGIRYLKRNLLLQRELESNCILEVLKGDAHSNTTRFWEAVIYNRKFYTNWKGVVDSPYYNPRFIRVFDSPDDLDIDFIKERIEVDYHYQGELSPLKYLELFDNMNVREGGGG
jgi:hypothetical protein